MVARNVREKCSESLLSLFLSDDLGPQETSRLADHLDECAACRQTLERLAAGTGICAALRESADEVKPPRPNRPEDRSHGSPRCDERIALEFLDPPAKPGSLGRLGPYDVTDVLGQGAFGIVLKALDPALSRFVAIKILASRLAASAAARSRFSREARAAAAVVHENVVAIHSVDSWNGLPYLVMPCISGRSLQERVDRDGPLSVKEVLRVGMQAARGLAAAHEQGIVHRDVKPSNILLENGVERVKLSDFGLARAVDDASQTQSGLIAGTPQYMSPEQARGESIDHRSDLFSLGGVMYFMCTGHPPFRADSTPAVLRRVCDDRHRPLRDLNPDLPEWLALVIDRLLAKQATARFATASDVADVLKHHLAELQRTGTSAPFPPIRPATALRRPGGRTVAAILTMAIATCVLFLSMAPGRLFTLLSFFGNGESRASNLALGGMGDAPSPQPRAGAPIAGLIVGSGHPATKTLPLADFDSLEITHPFRVEVSRADHFAITVTADDNVLEHVTVQKTGSALRIALAEGKNYRLKAGSIKATIGMPSLKQVRLSHGAWGKIRGFKSEEAVRVLLAHGSTLEGEIDTGNIVLDATHGSTIRLRGQAKSAQLTATHGSNLILTDLVLRAVEGSVEREPAHGLDADQIKGVNISAMHGATVRGAVEAGDITIEAGHGATIALRGHGGRAKIEAVHGSQLHLAGLAVDRANVKLGQSATATVSAREALDYDLEHGSTLSFVGTPKVGQSRTAHSSTARSVSEAQAKEEDEAAERDEPSTSTAPSEEEIVVVTAGWGSGVNWAGNPGPNVIVGSGVLATKTWDITDFSAVRIGSTFRVRISRGDKFQVTTSSDNNILEHLRVVKDGNTLRIDLEPGRGFRLVEPLKAEIVLPEIEGLEVGGASRATISGFRSAKNFKLKLHGASKVEGSIDAGDVEFALSGASGLNLTGLARAGRLSASGASHLRLTGFPVKQCEVRLSGASDAGVAVQSADSFKATVGDASKLEGSIDAKEVSVKLHGDSSAVLSGKADKAILDGKATSHLRLSKLVLQEARVDLSGVSQASIDVRKRLDYTLSSLSRLNYAGAPSTVAGTKTSGSTIHPQP